MARCACTPGLVFLTGMWTLAGEGTGNGSGHMPGRGRGQRAVTLAGVDVVHRTFIFCNFAVLCGKDTKTYTGRCGRHAR